MDRERFDRLTRDVAEELASRRRLLGPVVAGTVFAVLGSLGPAHTAAKKKKKKKGKKGRKKGQAKTGTGQCPANGQICNFPWQHCDTQGYTCGCGAKLDGSPFCGDCPVCIPGGCTSDADCVNTWGLPVGTICTVAAGGDCGCTANICLTPCGTCQNCSCTP